MAFKMNRPSMIEVSYNKEKNSVSPLHKETDPELTAEVIGGAVGGAISGSSSESNESGGMRNKLKQIGGKKAKSLGKEAKPLKPSVKKVNTLGRGDLAPRIPTSTGKPDYLKIEAKNLLMDNPVVKDATSQRSSESSNKRKVVKTKTVTKEGGKRKVYKTKTVSKG